MEELIGVLNYTDLKVNSSGGGGDLSNYYTKGETDSQIKKSVDKIKVPTKVSELSNDAGYLTQHQDISNLATKSEVSAVENKIPAAYELPVASAMTLGGVKVGSGLSITNGVLSATGGGVADSVDWSKVQNKPEFANVATSGDYNDLSNKPTIPSVEGLASEAYVNEKMAAIVIPEVPTKVSELENDKGYLTEHQSLAEYAKKTEIPTVPTNVSAFTNDAGYLTEHQSLADYALKSEIPSTTNLATKAEVQEVENKIPAPYTLPTASTSTLGGVKVDGSTITIADGVISAKGGSGGAEPDAYIKDASVSGNTLTLTKKDDTEVVFTPSGGSSGGVSGYHFEADTTLTDEDKTHIIEIWNNKNIPMFIGNKTVIRKFAIGATKYFCVINLNNTENKVFVYTIQTDALNTSVLSDKFTLALSYDLVSNTDGGYILTSNNWQNYINVGGGDWNYTSYSDGILYDAKELVIFYKLSGGQYSWKYINCSVDQDRNTGMTLGTGNLMNQMFSLESDTYYCWFNGSSFQFNGSGTCLGVLYKT